MAFSQGAGNSFLYRELPQSGEVESRMIPVRRVLDISDLRAIPAMASGGDQAMKKRLKQE